MSTGTTAAAVVTCPECTGAVDHIDGPNDLDGLRHSRNVLSEGEGALSVLIDVQAEEPVPPAEATWLAKPSLWVDVRREDVTPADCRRWAAALLEAAELLEQIQPGRD